MFATAIKAVTANIVLTLNGMLQQWLDLSLRIRGAFTLRIKIKHSNNKMGKSISKKQNDL